MTEKQHTFRKKPIDIQAFQMTRDRRDNRGDWPAWLVEASNKNRTEPGALFIAPTVYDEPYFKINTLEGEHTVTWNDWIVQGVKGEVYPIKPDIFAESYFAVNANPVASQPAEKLDLAKFEGCTPGPWKVVNGHYLGFVEVIGPSFKLSVVTSATDLDFADYTTRHADARLIAAAPDLLAEVRESRETIAQLRQQVEEMREGLGGMVDDYVNQHGHHDKTMCEEDRGGCPYCTAQAILARNPKQED